MTKDEILAFVPPAAKMLGREVVEIDQVNGGAVLRFRALPEFLNRHGTVQGGLLCAMLDSSTALALYAVLPQESTALTANLNVTFLKPAKLGTFTATSRLVTRDERNGETTGELRDAGRRAGCDRDSALAHRAAQGLNALMARTVKCVLLGVEAEGLDYAPYPGELGQRIYENVSKEAGSAGSSTRRCCSTSTA